jgi:hypothetical protein
MKPIRLVAVALSLLFLASPTLSSAKSLTVATADAAAKKTPTVDLVIALDTSNSMDGLIASAKSRLWDVVNELATAKPTPRLRVALYSYGNDSFTAKSGWVRQESEFTTDLDALYQKLSALRTNGGTEYVSRVGMAAADELKWDDSKDTLKLLFIAGNEPANQDPEQDPKAMAKHAISKGIVVNTIYCGSGASAEANGWMEVAKAADGRFAIIDQDKGVAEIPTPMDTKLAELSGKLNQTYVSYGRRGAEKKEAQASADMAASSMGAGVAASRAQAKAGKLYEAGDWDAVDAEKNKPGTIAAAPAAELPPEMQTMKPAEREAYVKEKAAEREKIQAEIATLSSQRQKFLADEAKKTKNDDTLGAALKKAVREEASQKGYTFEK